MTTMASKEEINVFLKSSMSCLIKYFKKNYFYTFVTNQFKYQMTKFRTKNCNTRSKTCGFTILSAKNAMLSQYF